jgi:lipopolysaccharide/colanic/teichoic acid biosynthesis glycosyltransferase
VNLLVAFAIGIISALIAMEMWGFAEPVGRAIIKLTTLPLDEVWRAIRRSELASYVEACQGERRLTALVRLLSVAGQLAIHDVSVGRIRKPKVRQARRRFSADLGGVQLAVKYSSDRAAALLFLFLLLPVIIAVAVAVRLSSRGPVLFRQRRVGRDGNAFDLYKFRSMRVESGRPDSEREEDERMPLEFLIVGDIAPGGVEGSDRRTLVGRFLHRTSLDELPQLLNVLRGEMSLIGPRPERPEFVELFSRDIVRYDDRHRGKPGITGWAQVHGLRGQTSLAERVEWDNYYIANWSLGLDLRILMLTFVALFRNAE